MPGRVRRLLIAVAIVASGVSVAAALAIPGDLDPTFDGDGRTTIGFGAIDSAESVAVQADGKIVVAGAGDVAFGVARLGVDGALDTGFAGDGTTTVGYGPTFDSAASVAVRPDGRIFLAGSSSNGNGDIAVAQLNPDGSPDLNFNATGKRLIDSVGRDVAEALALQPDGKVVLAGYFSAPEDFLVIRLNPDGGYDTTFAGDGATFVDFGGADFAHAVALQPDGKIVVVGDTSIGDSDIAVTRLNSDGTLDTSFNGTGKRTIDSLGKDVAEGVVVQGDGKIVVAGGSNGKGDFLVLRLNPNGAFDTTFAGDGGEYVDFGATDTGRAVALDANGKVIVVGYTSAVNNTDVAVARLQPGGTLDTTFDFDGKKQLEYGAPSGGRTDTGQAVALQADGKIVVAGQAGTNYTDFGVARLAGDPPPAGGGTGPGGSGGPGGGLAAAPRCLGKPATIVGTGGADVLRGTVRADVIVGLGGGDVIISGGGNDTICADRGNDRVLAGGGNDQVLGGDGRDVLDGGAGNDRLGGGRGNDRLLGRLGDDVLAGGLGNDVMSGGAGRDAFAGGAGRDSCTGGPGTDRGTCEQKVGI